MNKGIWKILTVFGFILAVIAAGMIVVVRMGVFDRGSVFMQFTGQFLEKTQELSPSPTQETTQEADHAAINLDKENLDRLQQGCFSGNDCIPSIDQPKFVPVRQAKFMSDDDLVIGVEFEGWQKEDDRVKAYPLKILNWHEVVNDFVNEVPLVISYSPLSMTPRVYERLFDGKAADFGVSDKLLNSNTVMYDRETKSLWSQFDGLALTGPKRGQQLKLYPSRLVRWADWVKQHPASLVLSEDTGFDRSYDQYPYGDYEKNSDIYYPVEHSDGRRKPKEVVFGVSVGGEEKAYPELELQKALPAGGTLVDQFAGKKLKITYIKKEFTVVDTQTDQPIPSTVSYYFTLEAFYPDMEIYQSASPG